MDPKVRDRTKDELIIRKNEFLKICNILDDLKFNCFLTSGILLGAIRDNDLIKWDWDIEISSFENDLLPKIDLISNKQNSGIAVASDVTKVFDIKNMINKTVEAFGSLDILVNNAGVTRTSNIMDLTEKDWDWIHNVNAKGTFFCLQVAASQMIKQNKGGRIINMASVGGKGFVDVSNAIYAASKGAVISLTKTAAQELAKHEITVNAICPGITHTNILSGIVKKRALEQNKSEEEIMKHYVRDIPLKRPNEPEDIAEMVVFLSSKGARNISGQSYNVDGGLIPS